MKERFECVFEGIEIKENKKLLDNIYTDLYITEGDGEAADEEHEVWQLETAFKKQSPRDTQIDCNDIFKPLPGEEQGGRIRLVLTKGVAGIGKTVSIQKFVLDWAEGTANQRVRFMFVFPFRVLNSVKDEHSLQTLLLGFHPELKCLANPEEYFDSDRTVLIFDGLDESRLPLNFTDNEVFFDTNRVSSVDALITNVVQGNLLSSALVWITTRPAAGGLIPSKYVHQRTEVRGFTEAQKEEYFRKRCVEPNQAEKMLAHIRASRSLQVMCHIPVFCWITATVFQKILRQTENNDRDGDGGDDGEIPKTLTQMYVHFLLIQTSISDQKYQRGHGPTDRKGLLLSHRDTVLKLAQLAFRQTMKENVIFSKDDLRECGIDAEDASVYSGMCTQIFQEESVFFQQKVFCFVHLSVQEFLAAFHALVAYADGNLEELKPLISKRRSKRPKGDMTLERLLIEALYTALNSRNGHLDLFLRFLLGLTLPSNQHLLKGLLANPLQPPHGTAETVDNMVQYIKDYRGKGLSLSPERCINLFHCLLEMNDRTMHRDIQQYLQLVAETGSGSSSSPSSSSSFIRRDLSPSFCSSLAYVLLMSEEVLDELDLRKYKTQTDEARRRLVPAVRCCRKALFSACNLNAVSCETIASALQSLDCPLVELHLGRNDLGDAGAATLFAALLSPHCKLQTLTIPDCKVTQSSCESLSAALQCPHSHLRELDLSHNQLEDSGVMQICKALKSRHCTLHTLRLAGCGVAEVGCRGLSSALRCPSSALRELDLTDNNLKDAGAKHLSNALGSPQCKLQKLMLVGCQIAEEGCSSLAKALRSNPAHLQHLDLSYNHPGDTTATELLSMTTAHATSASSPLTISVEHSAPCRLRSGLQKYACDLTLDINTAHRKLSVSENLKDVSCNMREQSYSDHALRCDTWQVFCREPQCRRAYWEVERGGWYGIVIGASYRIPNSSSAGGGGDISDSGDDGTSYRTPDSSASGDVGGNVSGIGDPGASHQMPHSSNMDEGGDIGGISDVDAGRAGVCHSSSSGDASHSSSSTASSGGIGSCTTGNSGDKIGIRGGISDVASASIANSGACDGDGASSSDDDDDGAISGSGGDGGGSARHSGDRDGGGRGGGNSDGGGSGGREDKKIGYNSWSWSLACYGHRYTARHNKRRTNIPAPVPDVCRIAVYLDWPAGRLSFYIVSRRGGGGGEEEEEGGGVGEEELIHLHTFHSTFTQPLYPAFRFIFAGSNASICDVTSVAEVRHHSPDPAGSNKKKPKT
ncbi:NACHT, LRR and PYD domains-containing protein 12-like isoform X2 [Engraulis encrasicolus]